MKDFGVSFAIGAGLASGFKSTLGLAGRKVNDLNTTIKGLERTRSDADRFAGLKRGLKSTEAKLRQTQQESHRLSAELEATEKPTKKLQQEFARVTKRGKKLKDNLASQKLELQRLRTGLAGAGISTTNLRHDTDALAKSLDRAKRAQLGLNKATKAQRANQARRAELQGQLVGAAAVGVAVVAPVKLAMDFESAMADVKKVVHFDSPAGFKQMGQDIMALTTSGGIPMAKEGIAAIVEAAGQSGLAKGRVELLAFAESAAKMGVAFDVGAEDAGKMLADWRSGMALNQDQALGLADAVNYLSNNMNANAGALGMVIQRQGAVAMSAGLTETQVASLGAALLSGGSKPEIAATALKNLTGALTDGEAATKAQQEAFAELGLDAEDMAIKMQENAPAAIREVFKALSEAPKAERTSLVSQLFGEESKGAIMPLLANLDNLDKAFSLTTDSIKYAGSMQAEFAERSKTSANELQLLKNQASRLGVNMGSVLLPPMVGFFKVIGPIVGGVATLTNKFPRTSATVIGLAAGVAGLTVATIGLGYAFTFVQGGLLNAQKMWAVMNARMAVARVGTIGVAVAQRGAVIATHAWTAAQWLLNIAMTANPIGLAVAGAVALGAVAVVLYKKWEPFRKSVDWLWSKMKGIGKIVAKFAQFSPAGLAYKAGKALLGGKKKGVDAAQTPVLATKAAPPRTITTLPVTRSSQAVKAAAGGGINLTVAPKIYIGAGGDHSQISSAVNEAMLTAEQRLREMIERLFEGDRRLSYES